MPNGHHIEIRPLKSVLIRTIPELAAELRDDRRVLFLGAPDGEYYSLQ